jgi:hypothetical protein
MEYQNLTHVASAFCIVLDAKPGCITFRVGFMIVPVLHDKDLSLIADSGATAIKSVDLSPGTRKVARQLVNRLKGVAHMVNEGEITARLGAQLVELMMSDYKPEESGFV